MQVDEEGHKDQENLPVLTRKAIIDFAIKYECTSNECIGLSFKLIEQFISEPTNFLQYAMKLLHHAIRNNKEVIGLKHQSLSQQGFNTLQRIKYNLVRVRNLKDLDENDVLVQLSQSEVYLCLADLADKDYKQVFNPQLSISLLSIEVFEKLV